MSRNSFGTLFTLTTWGESHGPAIGGVLDGCPAGVPLDLAAIQKKLDERAPGRSCDHSPRKEPDQVEFLSGLFDGVTTGAPLSFQIKNCDARSSSYDQWKDVYRPGHASFTYLEKYGLFDHRGGGRASARETACRVVGGAVALQLLEKEGIFVNVSLHQVGNEKNPEKFSQIIQEVKNSGDSIGGIVQANVLGLPAGLGEPVYMKLEALLASAMLSIPASKGFEIGEGFAAATMRGSEHNDPFVIKEGKISTESNHAGGTLGGISSGMPLYFRVPFKPTASIMQEQKTVNLEKKTCKLPISTTGRHDPCTAVRAVPVVQAMTALVLIDLLLINRTCRL